MVRTSNVADINNGHETAGTKMRQKVKLYRASNKIVTQPDITGAGTVLPLNNTAPPQAI